jgi:hypothetical protein
MTQVTVDSTLTDKLETFREPVQLVNEQGRVLGTFRPEVDRSLYRNLQPPLTIDELRQRADKSRGYTTQEVLDHLVSCDG